MKSARLNIFDALNCTWKHRKARKVGESGILYITMKSRANKFKRLGKDNFSKFFFQFIILSKSRIKDWSLNLKKFIHIVLYVSSKRTFFNIFAYC